MITVSFVTYEKLAIGDIFFLFSVLIIHDLCLRGSSRPDRLRDIADRFGVDHDAVLDNVLYARAYTSANIHLFRA